MGIKDFGKLAKLKIIPETGEPFVAMFNPESYSETFSVLYQKVENVNGGLEEYRYTKTPPQEFKLKLIMDGTGVTDYNPAFFPVFKRTDETVYDQVNRFLKLAWYPVNGKALPLTIEWGRFSFHCMLKEVTINYPLFDREGVPLRAELDVSFISDPEKNEKEYQQRLNPDKTVAGQTEAVKSAAVQSKSTNNNVGAAQSKTTGNGIVISVS